MFVPKPPFPSDIDKYQVFPSYENTYFEFKRNLQTFGRVIETICGMLNRKGGYIVFGVDDESHNICGVYRSEKAIDEFALSIDRIYKNQTLLTSDASPLHPDNIVIDLIAHPAGLVVVITVTPIEGIEYRLRTGEVYMRLNASNYKVKRDRLYTSTDVKQIMYTHQQKVEHYKERIKQQVLKMKSEYAHIESDKEDFENLLYQKILADKRAAEQMQVQAAPKGLLSLFCIGFH